MGAATLSRITTRRDFDAISDTIYQAFAGFGKPEERTTAWLRLVGQKNLRAVKLGGRVVACLGILPFGQWFGGRSVSCAGVTTVAVLPEVRGQGIGSAMMRAFIRELHAARVPLSTLYPSTKALYRKAGYEPAGLRLDYRLDAGEIGLMDRRSLTIRALARADLNAVKRIYTETARRSSGRLDRQASQWERIVRYGMDRVYAYGAFAGKQLDAYVYYSQHGQAAGPYEIRVRDMGARSKAGWERLLAFFSDHVFMAGPIAFMGGPIEPIVRAAREERVSVAHRHVWMMRIVDVVRALLARGYAAAVSGELCFQVEDDLIEENCGTFSLRLASGKAQVRRGGDARMSLNIRGLASLYSSHQSAFELRALGLADGPDADLELASAIFAGPPPAMSDRF